MPRRRTKRQSTTSQAAPKRKSKRLSRDSPDLEDDFVLGEQQAPEIETIEEKDSEVILNEEELLEDKREVFLESLLQENKEPIVEDVELKGMENAYCSEEPEVDYQEDEEKFDQPGEEYENDVLEKDDIDQQEENLENNLLGNEHEEEEEEGQLQDDEYDGGENVQETIDEQEYEEGFEENGEIPESRDGTPEVDKEDFEFNNSMDAEQPQSAEEFDARSEQSLDEGSEYFYEQENEELAGEESTRRVRAISPIIFDRTDTTTDDEEGEEEAGDDEISPPGESDVVIPKKEIILPPVEIRAERRERHAKMLKYLFREAHFYLIKSNNYENVSLAKAKGVWSTPPSNEAKINRSFREARNVILIFSIKESGAFQGFARVASKAKHDLSPVHWVLPPGLTAHALGGVFKLDWLCRRELSFAKTSDIYNPFNGNKQVKIGRDGQEVEPNAGKMLCLEFPHDDKINLEAVIQHVRKQQKASGGPPKYRPPQPVEDRKPGPPRNRRPVQKFPSNVEPYRKNSQPRPRERPTFSSRGNLPTKTFRNSRAERPRAEYSSSRRDARPVSNGGYYHSDSYQHGNSSMPPPRPAPNVYPSDPYTPYNQYAHYPVYQDAYPPIQTPNQPSSTIVSADKYGSDKYDKYDKYNKYDKYSSSSGRVSSRITGSSGSSRSYDSGSFSKRIYDSRSHAAACDDFVRRVASGRSSVSSSVSSSRSNRIPNDSYSRPGHRSSRGSDRGREGSRYSRHSSRR
ncbi:unnamed protein product [Clavelina lepadiformis]|uniref:YTH domain-containing protein n=1 Tax=Clavelina lepadiformis TaxID=159417 RepID=A0ABP0G1Q3_CLALP